ncbi:dihydropteroate synthase [Pseudorhizobium tarimense]|uniref:Dihydropteroate synthase n=1 Tax=Pseudorhizobium tarimense TaxID=1079109 RepID=A0ABV2H2V3_9HYPH|nr:dihydropteroate synthase [Pseudorhizobium tarimense]MCJ8518168.1 dihydropteroate synthase [Pseudorhizobium tarimense]
MTPDRNISWSVGRGRCLELGNRGQIMAIVNVTPDSFSDGGRFVDASHAVSQALACVEEGASILDIGGESTRPGAAEVSAAQEQDRVLPVIERLVRETDALISIDTYRAETARLAIAAGAHIVNDVHGLRREPEIARVVAAASAGLCIMHTGRDRAGELLPDVIADQRAFFDVSLGFARAAGVRDDAIVLDPGFGFAKDSDANLELMARFPELQDVGLPWLVGTSRKRFIGAVTGREKAADRDIGTAATTVMLRLAGAAIFRVHDVASTRDALAMADAVIAVQQQTHGDRK